MTNRGTKSSGNSDDVSDFEAEEIIERLGKKFRGLILNRKTFATILVVSVGICVLLSFHEFNEEWAWEIAKQLITIDVAIIGFTILGITISSERRISKTRFQNSLSEHFKNFFDQLRVVELAEPKTLRKKLRSTLLDVFVDFFSEVFYMPYSLISSMNFLFASLLLALPLFGVGDTTGDTYVGKLFFFGVMSLSITFLVVGIYLTIKSLEHIVIRKAGQSLEKPFKEETEEKEKP